LQGPLGYRWRLAGTLEQAPGARVFRRRIVVVEDWAEVPISEL
jgi:hypothetical protein